MIKLQEYFIGIDKGLLGFFNYEITNQLVLQNFRLDIKN